MAVITIPSLLPVMQQTWGQKRFDLRFANGDTGAGQSRIFAPPRWTTNLVAQAEVSMPNSAMWRAMILDLDGQVNQLAVYDFANPVPQGTLRGTVVLSVNFTAPAGSSTIVISAGIGQAGATLLRGDWIGVGSGVRRQLLAVSADVTLDINGVASVAIKPTMRWTQTPGSSVVWDRPTALFRTVSDSNSWTASMNYQGGYSLDMMESWE